LKASVPKPAAAAEVKPMMSQVTTSKRLKERKDLQRAIMTQPELEKVTLILTRQELAKATRGQGRDAFTVGQESNGLQPDADAKVRSNNRLKDKLLALEQQRSEAADELAQQIRSGTYRVSGSEILKGMLTNIG
jgi:anti-sigma28 factor (negative regulator of flagellin synthesis)